MYLYFLNGRTKPDQDTDGSGSVGPIVGPCGAKFVYGKVQVFDIEAFERRFIPMHKDLMLINGVYYSDMAFLTAEQADKVEFRTQAPRLTAEQFLALIS